MGGPLLHRVQARTAPRVAIRIDGEPAEAFEGESVLVAMLSLGTALRRHEADGAPRAGFCLMGACQDCWVWMSDGRRLRACTTRIEAGMELLTQAPKTGIDG